MTLDLGNDTGTAWVRWMASISAWRQASENGPVTVELGNFVIDLATIKQGWGKFAEGEMPEWIWDNGSRPPRPSDDHKRGFSVNLFSPRSFGEDHPTREWSSTSTGACKGIENLYAAWEVARADNPDKLPVVAFTGAEHAKIGKGNTSIPQFKIVDWTERPEGLSATSETEAGGDKVYF